MLLETGQGLSLPGAAGMRLHRIVGKISVETRITHWTATSLPLWSGFMHAPQADQSNPKAIDGEQEFPLIEYCACRGLDLEARLRLFDDLCGLIHVVHAAGGQFPRLSMDDVTVREYSGTRVVEISPAACAMPRSGRGPADGRFASGTRIGQAADLWRIGQLLRRLLVDLPLIPLLLNEIVDQASAIGTRRFESVSHLRAAIASFSRVHWERRGSNPGERHPHAVTWGLTPLPLA